jgi:hypothetical protein
MNIDDVIRENNDKSKKTNVSRETLKENYSDEVGESRGLPFYKVQSLDKPIEDYYNHALNKTNDEDLAIGLRGIDAYVGNTNLAIIDLMHLIKYLFKKLPKKEVVEDGKSES